MKLILFIILLPIIAGLIIGIIASFPNRESAPKKTDHGSSDFHLPSPSNIDIPSQNVSPANTINIASPLTKIPYDTLNIPDISGQIKYHCFKVKGKNPSTNRQKTVTVVAKEGSSEYEVFKRSLLLEPYTVSLDINAQSELEATDRQISYASDINIPIPDGCSMSDISCLIAKQKGDDSKDIRTNGLAEYASLHGVCLSPYCGSLTGTWLVLHNSNPQDAIFFFVYLIYCFTNDKQIENPNDFAYKTVLESFPCDISETYDVIQSITIEQYSRLFYKKCFDGRFKKGSELFKRINLYLSSNLS